MQSVEIMRCGQNAAGTRMKHPPQRAALLCAHFLAEEAGKPTPGASGPGNVEAGSGGGGYALLAAAHVGAAATCFIDPTAVGNFFFGGESMRASAQKKAWLSRLSGSLWAVRLRGCGILWALQPALRQHSGPHGIAPPLPTPSSLQAPSCPRASSPRRWSSCWAAASERSLPPPWASSRWVAGQSRSGFGRAPCPRRFACDVQWGSRTNNQPGTPCGDLPLLRCSLLTPLSRPPPTNSLPTRQLADANELGSPTAQRLQLGLMGFSAGGCLHTNSVG